MLRTPVHILMTCLLEPIQFFIFSSAFLLMKHKRFSERQRKNVGVDWDTMWAK